LLVGRGPRSRAHARQATLRVETLRLHVNVHAGKSCAASAHRAKVTGSTSRHASSAWAGCRSRGSRSPPLKSASECRARRQPINIRIHRVDRLRPFAALAQLFHIIRDAVARTVFRQAHPLRSKIRPAAPALGRAGHSAAPDRARIRKTRPPEPDRARRLETQHPPEDKRQNREPPTIG
jgi:hypothetical protein